MTHDEAKRECRRLAAEHPDRATHQWRPREEPGGEWGVVKIALPPVNPEQLTAELGANEKPSTADDPRSAAMRNLGPNVGPGF